ncbi:hypothetical protein Tco_0512358 [Tanacetum coccineum]
MIPKIYSAEWIRFLLMVIEWEVAKNLLHLWLSLGVRGVEKKCLRWWKLKKIPRIKKCASFVMLEGGIVELIGPEEEEDCRTAWEASILYQAQKEQIHGPRRGVFAATTDGHLILGLLV